MIPSLFSLHVSDKNGPAVPRPRVGFLCIFVFFLPHQSDRGLTWDALGLLRDGHSMLIVMHENNVVPDMHSDLTALTRADVWNLAQGSAFLSSSVQRVRADSAPPVAVGRVTDDRFHPFTCP